MGDLRIVRNAILHAKGIMTEEKHKSLKLLGSEVLANRSIEIPYEAMHRIFVLIKQDSGVRACLAQWLNQRLACV